MPGLLPEPGVGLGERLASAGRDGRAVPGDEALRVPGEHPVDRGARRRAVAELPAEEPRRPGPAAAADPQTHTGRIRGRHVPYGVAHDRRTAGTVEELDLVEQPMALQELLVDDARPLGAGQLTVEAHVLAAPGQSGRREQLGMREGGAVVLHAQMAVQPAGGDDPADLAELLEAAPQPVV